MESDIMKSRGDFNFQVDSIYLSHKYEQLSKHLQLAKPLIDLFQ